MGVAAGSYAHFTNEFHQIYTTTTAYSKEASHHPTQNNRIKTPVLVKRSLFS